MAVRQKNPRVFLELQIGQCPVGRIVIELFPDLVPKTADNFLGLCTGEYGKGLDTNKPLSYVGCKIVKVIPGLYIQTGDFVNNDGSGGESIYGGCFRPENYNLWHSHAGVVSMCTTPDGTGSQFYVTLKKAPQLNHNHVVCGQVRQGMEIIRAIERLPTDMEGRPKIPIFIVGSGVAKGASKRDRMQRQRQMLFMEEKPEDKPKMSAVLKGRSLMDMLLGHAAEEEGNWMERMQQQHEEALAERSDETMDSSAVQPSTVVRKGYDPEAAAQKIEKALTGSRSMRMGETVRSDSKSETAGSVTDLENQLTQLQQKLYHGQRLNAGAVRDSHKEKDPLERFLRKKRRPPGWSDDPKWYMSHTAAQAAQREARKLEKQRNISFGWNAYNARPIYRAHEKVTKNLAVNRTEYGLQKRALGDAKFYSPHAQSLGVIKHTATDAAKDRLAWLHAKRKPRLRIKTTVDLGDVDYISQGNRQYNKRLQAHYGEYALETKQNLERGTAL